MAFQGCGVTHLVPAETSRAAGVGGHRASAETTVGTRAVDLRTGQDDMYNPRRVVPEDDAARSEAPDRAFPEGPVKDGARVRGFVYFAKPEGMSRCDW